MILQFLFRNEEWLSLQKPTKLGSLDDKSIMPISSNRMKLRNTNKVWSSFKLYFREMKKQQKGSKLQ